MTKAEKQHENSYNIKGYKGACHILLSVNGGGGHFKCILTTFREGLFVMSSAHHAL